MKFGASLLRSRNMNRGAGEASGSKLMSIIPKYISPAGILRDPIESPTPYPYPPLTLSHPRVATSSATHDGPSSNPQTPLRG